MKRKQTNTIPGNQKYTIADFNCEFPNDDACLDHIFYARWPDGITVCDSRDTEMWSVGITASKVAQRMPVTTAASTSTRWLARSLRSPPHRSGRGSMRCTDGVYPVRSEREANPA